MRRFLISTALALFLPLAAFAQAPKVEKPDEPVVNREYVQAHYTKYEYRIPMRDGAKLFTAVYVPKDDSQTYPIMLMRTPYSVAPYGVDQYPDSLRPGDLYAQGRLHLRLSGRARPVDVRGRVRQHAAAQSRQEAARSSTRAATPTTRSTGSRRT